jgi:hypothetical protein
LLQAEEAAEMGDKAAMEAEAALALADTLVDEVTYHITYYFIVYIIYIYIYNVYLYIYIYIYILQHKTKTYIHEGGEKGEETAEGKEDEQDDDDWSEDAEKTMAPHIPTSCIEGLGGQAERIIVLRPCFAISPLRVTSCPGRALELEC